MPCTESSAARREWSVNARNARREATRRGRCHSTETDTPEVHRVRWGRPPRSPRAPIVAHVERRREDVSVRLSPAEQPATASSVWGDPHTWGRREEARTSPTTRPRVFFGCGWCAACCPALSRSRTVKWEGGRNVLVGRNHEFHGVDPGLRDLLNAANLIRAA